MTTEPTSRRSSHTSDRPRPTSFRRDRSCAGLCLRRRSRRAAVPPALAAPAGNARIGWDDGRDHHNRLAGKVAPHHCPHLRQPLLKPGEARLALGFAYPVEGPESRCRRVHGRHDQRSHRPRRKSTRDMIRHGTPPLGWPAHPMKAPISTLIGGVHPRSRARQRGCLERRSSLRSKRRSSLRSKRRMDMITTDGLPRNTLCREVAAPTTRNEPFTVGGAIGFQPPG